MKVELSAARSVSQLPGYGTIAIGQPKKQAMKVELQ
jgi:hypothetical protein